MRSIIAAVAGAASVLLAACATPSAAVSQPTLEGTAWTLKSLGGAPAAGTAPTLRFEGGRASGSDGCNRYTMPVGIKGFAIEFGPRGASTQMACPEATMRQAQQFAAALAAARTYKMGPEELQLVDAAGKEVAVFTWQTQALAGTRWKANNINNGRGAVVSVVKDSTVTLAFSNDGRVSGSAGCNQFNATYTQTRDQITIAPPATTRKMCPDAAVMEQEAAFVKALASAGTARVEGNRLELRTADGALAAGFVRDGN
jgi:heat shock protein HslJ